MSEDRGLLKLSKFPIHASDLPRIPKRDLAAVAAIGFSLNQVNVLARAYLSAQYDYESCSTEIRTAAFIQTMTMLRLFSSSLYEMRELFKDGKFGKRKGDGKGLAGLVSDLKPDLDRLDGMPGYKIAEFVRNKCSFHTDFTQVPEPSFLPPGSDLSLMLHESVGNTFLPLGENFCFHARLWERFDSDYPDFDWPRLFGDWRGWNRAMYDFANTSLAFLSEEILLNALPDRNATEELFWPSLDLMMDGSGSHLPLFMSAKMTKK